MELKDLIEKEIKYLREEMRDLKTCQVTFVTLSTTATGGLLGYLTFKEVNQLSGLIFLLPLLFIFPAWLIFFEKATTISRIVGYYRVLENSGYKDTN